MARPKKKRKKKDLYPPVQRCEAPTVTGKPCRAPALRGYRFCIFHPPELREDGK